MLTSFDDKVLRIVRSLANAHNPLMTTPFIHFLEELSQPGALEARRHGALEVISQNLRDVYEKRIIVLIDEYDSPMHSAIEHGYAPSVRSFSSPLSQLPYFYSRPTISLLQYSVHC
jgi:Predicted AAA-ATPase